MLGRPQPHRLRAPAAEQPPGQRRPAGRGAQDPAVRDRVRGHDQRRGDHLRERRGHRGPTGPARARRPLTGDELEVDDGTPVGGAAARGPSDVTRRTLYAWERTLLAWWRTGLAVGAVALAIGGLLPKVDHSRRDFYIAVGVAWGILALAFVVAGTVRDRATRRALEAGSFAPVPRWWVIVLSAYIAVTLIVTVALFV